MKTDDGISQKTHMHSHRQQCGDTRWKGEWDLSGGEQRWRTRDICNNANKLKKINLKKFSRYFLSSQNVNSKT